MKKLIAATMIGLSVLVVAGCGDSHKSATETAVTAQANSPEASIQKSIANYLNKSKFADSNVVELGKIEVTPLNGGYNVTIWAKLSDSKTWTTNSALSPIQFYAIPAYAGAFTSGQPIKHVAFIVQATSDDGKGNSKVVKVYQSELRDTDAAQYNWNNIDNINPTKVGTNIFIHKDFRK